MHCWQGLRKHHKLDLREGPNRLTLYESHLGGAPYEAFSITVPPASDHVPATETALELRPDDLLQAAQQRMQEWSAVLQFDACK
jgi:hypothetical protein